MLAFLMVIPLLILGLREWLSSFARHIPLQIDLFILPLLILITITLLTIGYQIIKASLTNPVEVLRYE
jgi:putative ABC transport system permease protein